MARPKDASSEHELWNEEAALVTYATIRESIGLHTVFGSLVDAVQECFVRENWKVIDTLGGLAWQQDGSRSDDGDAGDLVVALHLNQLIFAALGGRRLTDWGRILSALVERTASVAVDEGFDRDAALASAERALDWASSTITQSLTVSDIPTTSETRVRRVLAVVAAVNMTQHNYTFSHTTGKGSKKREVTFEAAANGSGRSIAVAESTLTDVLRLRTSRRPLVAKKGQTKPTVPTACTSLGELTQTLIAADRFTRDRLDEMATGCFSDEHERSEWRSTTESLPHFWCEFFIEAARALAEVDGALTKAIVVVANEIATALSEKFASVPRNLLRVVAKFLLNRLASAVGRSQVTVACNVCRALAVLSCPCPPHHDTKNGGNDLNDVCLFPLFKGYLSTALRDSSEKTLKDEVDEGLKKFLDTGRSALPPEARPDKPG